MATASAAGSTTTAGSWVVSDARRRRRASSSSCGARIFNHMGVTSDPLSAERRASLPASKAPRRPRWRCAARGWSRRACREAGGDPRRADRGPRRCTRPGALGVGPVRFDLVLRLCWPRRSQMTRRPKHGPRNGVFSEIGCDGCHLPSLLGPRGAIPAYTDLLVHDMGDELADGFPMGAATGHEFRTQPLWGIAPLARTCMTAAPQRSTTRSDGTVGRPPRSEMPTSHSRRTRATRCSPFSNRSAAGHNRPRACYLPMHRPRATGEYGAPLSGLDGEQRALFDRRPHPLRP